MNLRTVSLLLGLGALGISAVVAGATAIERAGASPAGTLGASTTAVVNAAGIEQAHASVSGSAQPINSDTAKMGREGPSAPDHSTADARGAGAESAKIGGPRQTVGVAVENAGSTQGGGTMGRAGVTGTAPPGTLPPGTLPPGTLPPGTLPPGTLPPGTLPPGALELAACELEDPSKVAIVLAECGELSVAENPAEPSGRHITLRVARVPAINRRKQPDPLFVLAGGPGMAATSFYASAAHSFERIHRDRDIVLVDQRGTGKSNFLNCSVDDNDLYHATPAEIRADAQKCLTTLQKSSHVEFYTTSVAVRDLDAVRIALGYQRINLYGVSYGTRVAQHYVRRFPERTRSVILDGVVPPQLALGTDTALNAEHTLTAILDRCAHDAECSERFGDPAVAYHTLRDSLQAHTVSVNLSDPTSGEPSKLEFTSYHLASVLRLASYTAEQAALLPLMLHSATGTPANFIPLASQFLLVNRSYGDAVANGMHNSVVCTEDVPFWDLSKVNRAELEKTYLGTAQLDGLQAICSIWPRGPIDPDFHAQLHSDVPALLLSGGDDPVTPPPGAEQAKRGFSHSMHVVLAGFGHGQLAAPCVDRVMGNFVAKGSVEELDVSCVKKDVPMPFFTTIGGPSP